MNKEFVLYEEALALKQLGFDDPCVFYVNKNNESFIYNFQTHPDEFIEWCGGNVIKAPTYKQAFRWFRKNYKLSSHVDLHSSSHLGYKYYYKIINFADSINASTTLIKEEFDTYEEAELACLRMLIKLVK